jgi:hypothetical protein
VSEVWELWARFPPAEESLAMTLLVVGEDSQLLKLLSLEDGSLCYLDLRALAAGTVGSYRWRRIA